MTTTVSDNVLAGRYRLGKPLGKGGWGAVYEATQLDLGRRVAVKVLHADSQADPGDLARFEREARAAAALGHPNIVQVLDFVAQPGLPPFIVLEHLEGQTLAALLASEHKLTPARAIAIVKQMLAALEAAHRAGIVHRDVKPANVFLVSGPGITDFVKLLDFGVAKVEALDAPKLTAMGAAIGTPHFMPPEQVLGKGVDARVDLYAVGVTLYLALSGRYPYEGDATLVMRQVIDPASPPPLSTLRPDLPAPLLAIVDRAMAKDPGQRFPSADAMRAALEDVDARPRPEPATVSYLPPPRTVSMPAPPPSHAHAMAVAARASSRRTANVFIGLLVGGIVLAFVLAVAGFVIVMRLKKPVAAPSASATSAPAPTQPPAMATASVTATASASAPPPTTAAAVRPAQKPAKPLSKHDGNLGF